MDRTERFAEAVPAQAVIEAAPGDIPFQGHVGVSVTLPKQPTARTGLLLMIHGLGSHWQEHDKLAPLWADAFDLICVQIQERHSGARGLEIPIDLGKYQTIDALRAVEWALARYEPDPHRVIAWGGSGGGHLVLQCALFAPDLLAAAISCCPFTDATMPGEITGEWQDGWMRRCIPDGPVPDVERTIRSPLANIARLTVPTLLMHGSADTVVSVAHSRRLAAAASEAGVPLRYAEIPDGDHNFKGGPETASTRKAATEHLGGDYLRARRDRAGRIADVTFACGYAVARCKTTNLITLNKVTTTA